MLLSQSPSRKPGLLAVAVTVTSVLLCAGVSLYALGVPATRRYEKDPSQLAADTFVNVGPFPVSEHRLAELHTTLECWASAGRGGAWVRQSGMHTLWNPTDACSHTDVSAECGFPSSRTPTLEYAWVPSPACPRAPTWNRTAFASFWPALTKIAVVGDSVSDAFARTLDAALNCAPQGSRVRVVHHRDSRLSMREAYIDTQSNCASYEYYPQLVSDASVRVVVFNRGAYYEETPKVLASVEALVSSMRRDRPDVVMVYRTTAPGHPECGAHRSDPPLSLDQVLQLRANSSAAPHHWDDLSAQNEAVRRMLAMRHPHVLVLDVEPMTEHRRDSHRADCLHYCTPGPMDAWVEALGRLLYALGKAVDHPQ